MNIFIITSVLKPTVGIIPHDVRYKQTLNTINSIREKVKDSLIILLDSSPSPLDLETIQELKSKTDYFISLMNHTQAMELSSKGMKTPGEIYIMVIALDIIKNLTPQNVNRVFKITGRGELTDRFKIEDYDDPEMRSKYVFKKSVVSWMNPNIKLVDTRLWSFDFDMLDEVDKLLREAFTEATTTGLDLEHVMYKLIDKEKLFEKDVIGVKCQLASTGDLIDE
jgi:hypothetical protein